MRNLTLVFLLAHLGACSGMSSHLPLKSLKCLGGTCTNSGDKAAALAVPLDANAVPPSATSGLPTFGSCSEMQTAVSDQLKIEAANLNALIKWRQDHPGSPCMSPENCTQVYAYGSSGAVTAAADLLDAPAAPGLPAGATGDNHSTGIRGELQQVVDARGDYIKIGTHHLYAARHGGVEVVDRASLSQIGHLSESDLVNVVMFAGDDQLVVLGEKTNASQSVPDPTTIIARFYHADAGAVPLLVKELSFPGAYTDARYTGDRLLIAFNSRLPLASGIDATGQTVGTTSLDQPVQLDAGADAVLGVACTRIVKPAIADSSFTLSRIVAISAHDPAQAPQMLGVFGGTTISMGAASIIVAQKGVWNAWVDGRSADDTAAQELKEDTELILTQIKIAADGSLIATSTGQIDGMVYPGSFEEFPSEKALVAVTVASSGVKLFVLDESGPQLSQLAQVQMTSDNIRLLDALRFVDHRVYIGTDNLSKPLQAYDFSDLKSPVALNTDAIVGLYNGLTPVTAGRMINIGAADTATTIGGVGYGGFHITLNDTSDAHKITQLDAHELGTWSNDQGIFFDLSTSIVGVPVTVFSALRSDPDQEKSVIFSGAILYSVGSTTLTEMARITHSEWAPKTCTLSGSFGTTNRNSGSGDIDRLYNLDGRLISVSMWGIKSHDMTHGGATIVSLQFPDLSSFVKNANCWM